MNFITFTINLTETTIQINDDKTIYPLTIEFNNNEINVCQKEINDNTITGFVEELFNNPTEYNKYTIKFIFHNFANYFFKYLSILMN